MEDSTSERNATPVVPETAFSAGEIERTDFSYSEAGSMETSEETIRRVLSSYELGPKLKHLRLRKKIGLVDLGKHTGLSASMLSQLENGKLVPTLATLARIAMVFDVGLDYFFTEQKRRRPFLVVRAEDRIKFPDRPAAQKPDYFFECLAFSAQEKSLQAYIAEFPRKAASDTTEHYHEGAEFIHVLEGSLGIRYGGEDFSLNAGDSVYFDSAEAHAYRCLSKQAARAIVVTTPPRL